MRRSILLATAAGLAVTLAACGGGGSSEETTAAGGETTTSGGGETAGTLTVWVDDEDLKREMKEIKEWIGYAHL